MWRCRCLAGTGNLEGRINRQCRANYLASPPLVVAYAIAGRMDLDIVREPLGNDKGANQCISAIFGLHRRKWNRRCGARYKLTCSGRSTLTFLRATNIGGRCRFLKATCTRGIGSRLTSRIRHTSTAMPLKPASFRIARAARPAVLGDSITTDHISPAGSIPVESPAWKISDRVRRSTEGLQFLRRAPWQPRSDDARDFREYPGKERARARHRGRLDDSSARARRKCLSTTRP